jgi:hypothetical protein
LAPVRWRWNGLTFRDLLGLNAASVSEVDNKDAQRIGGCLKILTDEIIVEFGVLIMQTVIQLWRPE